MFKRMHNYDMEFQLSLIETWGWEDSSKGGEHLPYKLKDQNLNPQHLCKKPAMITPIPITHPREGKTAVSC